MLTSFDWNEGDPNLMGTTSVDDTDTIWGLEIGQVVGLVNVVSGHEKTQTMKIQLHDVLAPGFNVAFGGFSVLVVSLLAGVTSIMSPQLRYVHRHPLLPKTVRFP